MRVALALAAGAAIGRVADPPRAALALVLAALAGAWIAGRALELELVEPATAEPRPRATTIALLGALAALCGGPSPAPREPPFEGRFEPARRSARGLVARVERPGADAVWIEVPLGAVDPGEWIRVTPTGAPQRDAVGPEPAPRPLGQTRSAALWLVHADEIERRGREPPWERWNDGWQAVRRTLVRRCDALEPRFARGLARALVCGETSALAPELAHLFTRTGLRHLLAVSGMHVSLLAALLLAPWLARTRRRGARGWMVVVAVATVLAAYAALTGSNAPVRRAVIALGLALAVPLAARRGEAPRRVDTLSLWALGLVLELAADARSMFSLSVQLSYAATLGLILATQPLASAWRTARPRRRAPRLGPTTLAAAARRVLERYAYGGVAASMAAVGATLPLVWCSFGEWSPIGVLATPLVTPIIAWLLLCGWLIAAAPGWVPTSAFEWPAEALVELLRWFDRIPSTPSPLPPRPLWLLCAAVAAWILAVRSAVPWKRARWTSVAALATALLLAPWSLRPRGLEVVALDVGHGTSVALRPPLGPTWIFDAGSRDRRRVGPAALAPLLARWETGEVCVVASHGERDHVAAFDWLLERYPPAQSLGALAAPRGERIAHSSPVLDLAQGRARIGFDARIDLALELVRGLDREGNEGSRSLRVSFCGAVAVLHGDAVEEGLERALEPRGARERVALLLWPHHGDDTRWSGRLLALEGPSMVWISAARRAPIEAELARRAIPFRSTAHEGPLVLELGPGARAPPWHGSR